MTVLLSVFTHPFILTLEEQIFAAKYAGFDGLDYVASMKDLFSPPNKILQLTKKHGMEIKSVHIPLPLLLYTPPLLFNNIKNLLTYFPEIKIFNFHLSGFLTPLGRYIHELEAFRKIMIKNKINISCESNPDEYFIFKYFPKETYDPDSFAKFCISHKLPTNLDTSHIAAWDYDIVKFLKKYHSHINLMHVSDMTSDKQHLPFGKGNLPLEEFFKTIKDFSYKGLIVFEIAKFPKGSSKKYVQEELKRSKNMFKRIALS